MKIFNRLNTVAFGHPLARFAYLKPPLQPPMTESFVIQLFLAMKKSGRKVEKNSFGSRN